MRLHRLDVTAFGPFADTVEVDFDALSDAGLFLLTGATGAGKTSVLDAVCFALYGDVPGDRATAKRLRSDHAEVHAAPRVTLECTLAGRRFRIVRSPAWTRPKKRGTGTTFQQASVTLSERVDGCWTPLSSRLDETGQLIGELLGMNLTQFTQVAMLPQGRFQAFLRAPSDQRQRLLQQLFRTGRFERVERWLRDRRLALSTESQAHQESVDDLVSRISETAGVTAPGDRAEALAWSRELAGAAVSARRAASEAEAVAAACARSADLVLREGQRVHEQQQRLRRVRAERAELLERADDMAALRERLSAARCAAGLLPLHRAADGAESAAAAARADATHSVATAERHTATTLGDLDAIDHAERAATRTAAAAAAAGPDEQRLAALRESLHQAQEELETGQVALADVDHQLELSPECITRLRQELDLAGQAAAGLLAAQEKLAAVAARRDAARAIPTLAAELQRATVLLHESTDRALSQRELWLTLQEQRITGMAAELAGQLAVGGCCPVCGSADHPQPAEPRADAPAPTAEKRARRELDDAETTRHAHADAVRTAQTNLALARQAAHGVSEADALREHAAAAEACQGLAAQAEGREELATRLRAAELDHEALRRRREELLTRLTTLETRIRVGRPEADALATRLAELLTGSSCADLAELRRERERTAEACRVAARALQAAAAAERASKGAQDELARAVRESGFADISTALLCLLPDAEVASDEKALREYDASLATQELLVADPELLAAARLDTPDLAQLATDAQQADTLLQDCRAAAATTGRVAERLTVLGHELAQALAGWSPLLAELDLVTRMAQLVEGKSADNRVQMRLSAYVLGYRLGQVVAAANQRLAAMSDRRYSLEHSAHRGAGETRGGLSLLVRDDWSGESRDPATLSGGETFVVSLALALGLADVITHETGGADLDTLFVDEGFGALDAETLEDVMDTLDSLRDGGRVVGVVSHVAEMAHRIPTQLQVVKGRGGSTLRVTSALG